jgi:hypothetical protein
MSDLEVDSFYDITIFIGFQLAQFAGILARNVRKNTNAND